MKAYAASRFDRQQELSSYIDRLAEVGIEITSNWINGHGELGEETPQEQWDREGQENYDDIDAADAIILFTQDPVEFFRYPEGTVVSHVPAVWARGGMYVEFGYAAAKGKALYVIGPRTNIFTMHSAVSQFDTIEDFIEEMRS